MACFAELKAAPATRRPPRRRLPGERSSGSARHLCPWQSCRNRQILHQLELTDDHRRSRRASANSRPIWSGMTHTSLQALILPRALRGGDAPGMRLLIGEAPPGPEILIPVPVPSPDHPHIITARVRGGSTPAGLDARLAMIQTEWISSAPAPGAWRLPMRRRGAHGCVPVSLGDTGRERCLKRRVSLRHISRLADSRETSSLWFSSRIRHSPWPQSS